MDTWRPQPRLRQKLKIDLDKSDKELFQELALGDVWSDADLAGAYKYFRGSNRSRVPNSWQPVFEEFDAELAKVSPN